MDSKIRTLILWGALAVPAMALQSWAASINLAWDPNTETDLAGYTVHYGTTSARYTTNKDVASTTTTITNLADGTFYFAVTARNTSSQESSYSNEVSTSIAGAPGVPCDLNGDGGVNAVDLQSLANAVLGLRASTPADDMNHDGLASVLDIQVLVNVLLGKIVCP
jgi:hypothetical protein